VLRRKEMFLQMRKELDINEQKSYLRVLVLISGTANVSTNKTQPKVLIHLAAQAHAFLTLQY
jgi:hypothetical protein